VHYWTMILADLTSAWCRLFISLNDVNPSCITGLWYLLTALQHGADCSFRWMMC